MLIYTQSYFWASVLGVPSTVFVCTGGATTGGATGAATGSTSTTGATGAPGATSATTGAATGGAGVVRGAIGCARRSVYSAYAVVSCLGLVFACIPFVSSLAVIVWARVRGDLAGCDLGWVVRKPFFSAIPSTSAIYRSKIDSSLSTDSVVEMVSM